MFQSLELLVGQTVDLEEILKSLVEFGYRKARSVLTEGDFAHRGGVLDIFPMNYDCPVRVVFDDNRIRFIDSINLKTSKSIWKHKILIVLPQKKTKTTPFHSDTPLNTFIDIERGDYVVHANYGIGRFLGLTERLSGLPSPRSSLAGWLREGPQAPRAPEATEASRANEYLVVEYLGGDKLFVPRHDMHLVQKYVGFHKKPPKLYPLGSKEWKRLRTLIQKRIQQFAAQLLHLQAMRFSLKGHTFSKDTDWQKEFENFFPFEETPDQIKATREVKSDMESPKPMDRLLCGDVGYGKTEVAMRAAFKAVMDGRQVAILVPTTILAEQHFYNFQKRLENLPVRVAMLSRFRTKHEQKKIIEELALGRVDIVVGTHRLLSSDIVFKDLGLLIIDEEQRFGVRAKERLKHLRLLVDVLTLTATPIPRTLYMALVGARDMSIITTPPQNRVAVATEIIEFDEDLIQQAVHRELKRKGQVFFLHNRVEDIEKIARLVGRLVPQARLAVAHGQMSARLLEEIMLKFLNNEIEILVCTTIIESGIDIPNANTLIVNRAEELGLADLHQLRGRVGRFNRQAFAYFIVPPKAGLSREAKARLEALKKNSELGAGFQLAFEDLQIRGAGNLLGEEQHGYIASVGFDLYCRLLKESIENLKRTNNVHSKENITKENNQ